MVVFDVKMDLTRKARICAQGDQTDPPLALTYASVVTRESVRLAFLLATLNGNKLLAADISGAYLNAPCAERIHTVLSPESGELQGRTAVFVKAIYGLRSSGFAFRTFLARVICEEMNFLPCRGDMDVCRREATKSNGEKYLDICLCTLTTVFP